MTQNCLQIYFKQRMIYLIGNMNGTENERFYKKLGDELRFIASRW